MPRIAAFVADCQVFWRACEPEQAGLQCVGDGLYEDPKNRTENTGLAYRSRRSDGASDCHRRAVVTVLVEKLALITRGHGTITEAELVEIGIQASITGGVSPAGDLK